MTLLDADGKEITVGCTVRHKHEPLPVGEGGSPERWHNFFGASEVLSLGTFSVTVRPTCKRHIATHLPENLLVVAR